MLPFYGGAQAKLNIGIINLPCEGYHLTEKNIRGLQINLLLMVKLLVF